MNKMINKLVEQKIAAIVPDLVKRATKAVEAKIRIEGCLCFKKEGLKMRKRSESLKK